METIRVKLFARFAEVFGSDELAVSLPSPIRLSDLRAELARLRPELKGLIGVSAFAVNEEYAEDERPVSPADEVAVLPPVSGG